ncbi:hypothetical protein LZG74_16950 [Dyadobacter sp. CY327]|uniref:hypothetical protein n=1 Tax=Dyadobacter sp. CY327 TaxID=2907301 RepID=UPI001F25D3F3|nr:hypothetical protein [Dyadobacter sp. CY327]MCE7072007.1 hypothetical protein [Dyadobacter sp. CY327]
MIRLRKNSRNEVRTRLKLSDLIKNQDDYNKILDVYLDPVKPRKMSKARWKGELFEAIGTGYDGEAQLIRLLVQGDGLRMYLDKKGHFDGNLPFQNGKILNMLKQMGYELTVDRTRMAYRYKNYTETGISHLDCREEEQSF